MLLTLLLQFAHASPSAIVIRYDAGGGGSALPLVATLSGSSEPLQAELKDDGQRPDAKPGDGRFAGVAKFEGKLTSISVSAGGREVGKTSIVITSPDGTAQDIDLTLTAGALNARVSTPPAFAERPGGDGNAPASGDGAVPAPPPEAGGVPASGLPGDVGTLAPYNPAGGAGGVPGDGGGGPPPAGQWGGAQMTGGGPGVAGAAGAGGAPPPPTSASGGPDSGGLLFIGFGLGLLAVLGIVWLRKRRGEDAQLRSANVVLVPEPGLVHAEFPALSAGLSAWVAPGDDGRFRQALLSLLADRHRVLVLGRADIAIKPVLGGPVYRVVGVRPGVAAGVAVTLAEEAGPPLVVLIVLAAADGATLLQYRDQLPSTLGGVVLLESGPTLDLPRVDVATEQDGWRLTHRERVVLLGPEAASR
ncbi:MAG: hypothetical protein EXR71_13525 [Myxococcales bacterium]|nr:hypothetical protein [Myxococcales bacterium]